MTLPKLLLDKIEMIPVTDCWIWTGAVSSAKSQIPAIKIAKRIYPVRKLVYEAEVGELHDDSLVVVTTCGQVRCVCPDHLNAVVAGLVTGAKGREKLRVQGAARTHFIVCGHPRSPENTRVRKAGNGGRDCRECHRKRRRDHKRQLAKNPRPHTWIDQETLPKRGPMRAREEMRPSEVLRPKYDRNKGAPQWLKEWRSKKR